MIFSYCDKKKKIAMLLFGIGPAIWLTCAAASAQTVREPKAQHTNGIERSCALTMGFDPASAEYAACVDSLKHTAAVNETMEGLKQQRLACIQQGFAAGTPDFAKCVANRPDAGRVEGIEATKESKACEEIGLAPGDSGFSSCVINLRSASESSSGSYALMH